MRAARTIVGLRPLARFLSMALLIYAPTVFAQDGATAAGSAQAEVVTPISAVPLSDLSFGSIVIGFAGQGSVEVAPDGSPPRYINTARSLCSGETDCIPHRAFFAVSGEPNWSYRVSLPRQVMAYGVRTGIGLPVVDLDVRSFNAPSAMGEGRLDTAGRDSFFVGGTLQVPAGTRPDVFRAELPVIVTYD